MGMVTIHVFDDARKVQQDFTCELHTLLTSMRYFQTYLKKVGPAQDVEISVHCDMVVFAWLLRYAKMAPSQGGPRLSLENCLPILIASHFLQMEQLVTECAQFIGGHLMEVMELKVDIANNSEDILSSLAKAVSEHTLETIWLQCTSRREWGSGCTEVADRCKSGESVVETLYKHKIHQLLKEQRTSLRKCRVCGELFSTTHRVRLRCVRGKGGALVSSVLSRKGLRGQPLMQHEPQPSWRLQQYMEDLHDKRLRTWREIYWHLWGRVVVLPCYRCNRNFPASEWLHCNYHPKEAVFPPGKTIGHFPCCKHSVHKCRAADVEQTVRGCMAREHQIAPGPLASAHPQSYLLVQHGVAQLDEFCKMLEGYGHLITTPYRPPNPPKEGPKKAPNLEIDNSDVDEDCVVSLEDANQHSEGSSDVNSLDGRGLLGPPGFGCHVAQGNASGSQASPQAEDGLGPRTLLGRVASTPSPSSGCTWSPRHKFRSSALGKALRVELMWEDDAYRIDALVDHLTRCRTSGPPTPNGETAGHPKGHQASGSKQKPPLRASSAKHRKPSKPCTTPRFY